MRIVITGAAGMLGTDVRAAAAAAGIDVVALAHADLDIGDERAVMRAISDARADVVLNLAAYTNVDGAQSDRRTAFAVNAQGAGNLARTAAQTGAWIIHVSSDYVFDGSKRTPYLESDPTGPLSVYGASKLGGEEHVAREAPDSHTIVRSSWLFGTGGPCFPATMLALAGERDNLTVVDDQVGCPTYTGHLAGALLAIATEPERRLLGVVHVAAAGECSWWEFAREIMRSAGAPTEVRPGTTAQLGRPAPRPAYSVMRSERGSLAPELPHWADGLSAYMNARVSSG